MDTDITKIRAKDKVRFLTVLLLCGGILGGIYEYHMAQLPLDEINVIYLGNDVKLKENVENIAVNTSDKVKKSDDSAQIENNQTEETAIKDVKVEPAEISVKDNNPQALNEFLGEMKDIRARVDAVQVGGTILDRLKQSESPKENVKKIEEPVFENGKIEIYDSEKGVVEVVEEPQNLVKEVADVIAQTEEKVQNAPVLNEETAANPLKSEENVLLQQINNEIEEAESNGEEAPVVLIPGIVAEGQENIIHE